MDLLAQARALVAAGRLREAGAALSQILRAQPQNAGAMQLLAVVQFQTGFQKDALKLIERAVSIDPANGEAWANLGLMRHVLGDDESALEALTRAIAADPKNAEAYKNRAFILQSREEHGAAISDLEEALSLGLTDSATYFFLGNSYAEIERHEMAIPAFRKALELDPDHADAWNNLGNSLVALEQFEEAVAALNKAAKYLKTRTIAHQNLASALYQLGRPDEALALVDQVLTWDPSFAKARELRATLLPELEQTERLAKALADAPEVGSEMTEARAALARSLQAQGKWRLAVDSLRAAKEPALQVLEAMTLPVIFESADMPKEALDHMEWKLAALAGKDMRIDNPDTEIGVTPFHLPYFGVSDRPYLDVLADVISKSCPNLQFTCSHTPRRSGRIRVGVVSALLNWHTVYFVFGPLIERLDRERFEIVFLQLGKSDAYTKRIVAAADKHVIVSGGLSQAQRTIAGEELDILVYPEIGMHVQTYYHAMSRLAPVQVTTWGHPMSSGSPVVDHYISARHLEREGAQAEYREKLALLDNLGMYFEPPAKPEKVSRADLGLPEGKRLYGCMQSAYKFHPDYDRVLSSILEQDDQGILVLPEPARPNFKQILKSRWAVSYPLVAEQALWVPPMALERFLGMLQLCDALLAPIQFGGGRSSFEAFGVGAPVVTHKGEFLKSRITYAAYAQMGMLDLVAESEEQYIHLALRLAKDRDWQRLMRREVQTRSDRIYRTSTAVAEVNDFLESIAPG